MKSHIAYRISHIAKDSLLCLFSAILLILSFPRFDLEFLAWFGFVFLFRVLESKSKLSVFFLSYFTGIIFWAGIIYWLVHVTLPGTIVLILYLALYFGIFGLIIRAYSLQLTAYSLIFIPSVWVLLEYIRAHLFTGFPWALLGYTQYLNLPIIQVADITGAWGISFLVMMVNVAIYSLLTSRFSLIVSTKKYLLVILCFTAVLIYGYNKLHYKPHILESKQLKISVIQGNIPQELKWDPQAKDYILNKYLDISRQTVQDKPDLLIWPEAALPVILEEEPVFFAQVKSLAKEIKIPLLLGAVTYKDNFYYNSALLVSAEGEILHKYDKLHLVPFGEYIPLKRYLPFLETVVPIGDITAGKDYTIFSCKAIRFSVLICFEDLFPELSRQFIKRGAHFLVNITNDAWYKKTAAASQHLQASVFRAVENRVYLARSANTGISGFIAPDGKIISLVQDKSGKNIFIDGFNTQEIIGRKKAFSFYTRFGDIFVAACLLFVLYVIITAFKNKR